MLERLNQRIEAGMRRWGVEVPADTPGVTSCCVTTPACSSKVPHLDITSGRTASAGTPRKNAGVDVGSATLPFDGTTVERVAT